MKTIEPQVDEAPLRFAGYAAIFGRRDSGGDIIVPGAFAATLASHSAEGQRLPLFWQHRPEERIGWVDMAVEDTRGLRVIATVTETDTPAARALVHGDVSGLSFGYRVKQGRALPDGRELRDVDLLEISLVTRPMQALAQVHYVSKPDSAVATFRVAT